jgi:hypothetical protein
MDDRGSIPGSRGGDFFLLPAASRSVLGPTQPPIQWVQGALTTGVKRPGYEADNSPPSTISSPPYIMAWCLIKQSVCLHGVIVKHRVNFRYEKVKFSLCFTKHHAIKTHEGVEVQIHALLTLELDGREWSVSRPGRFTLGKGTPETHWTGGWLDPTASLDVVENRDKSLPCPSGIEPPQCSP